MTRSPGQRCKKIIGERAPAQTGLLPLFAVLPSRNIYYGPHLHKIAIYACLRALSLGELGRPSHAGQVASGAPLDPNAPIWPRHERWWTIESKTAYNGINVRWSNGVRGVTGRHSTADGLGWGRPLFLRSAVALRLANDEELAVWADDSMSRTMASFQSPPHSLRSALERQRKVLGSLEGIHILKPRRGGKKGIHRLLLT
ncbi:hypothetical protein CISG_03107 [Coccidioides immitis RMSCC 3703]|uniref:Uncharacterized protein n=1 Tax=Coccidioides immitis RMSCC 3703 TaxID=454286 RepID=A0A0J8QJ18_COCIT|nr:hypothetical protein CISG_03107 [Coccidioides immitis RMSCC 3703]